MKDSVKNIEGVRTMTSNSDPYSTSLHRHVSNQSTIDSESHLDLHDPNVHAISQSEKQRRLRLLMDQCETVRFPFKKRLILANLNLSHEEIPVDQLCSDRLGATLYKLSLSGNRLNTIPEPLFGKLTGLRVLDLSQCDLHSVPDKWELPFLKKLNLSHNCIQNCLPQVRSFDFVHPMNVYFS
jgi:Leucine-rich repeat (LRR) protein